MQILLHADPHTDGSQPMTDHLTTVVKDAMKRFGERITRVEAHLSDASGPTRSGTDDIHCTLQAQLVGQRPVVVKDSAGNAHQAIEGAVRKLQRAVGSEIARRAPRGARAQPVQPLQDDAEDA